MSYDARARGAYLSVADKDGETRLKFCAEPPPDVAANLEAKSDLDVNVDAMFKYKLAEAALKGGGQGSDSATSEIADSVTRTELVLVMRDAMYRICELNANGVMSEDKALEAFTSMVKLARSLGQRDNVGKLIDVVRVMLENDPPSDSAQATQYSIALIKVLETVTILATSEHLHSTSSSSNGLVEAAIETELLNTIVGVQQTQSILSAQLQQLQREIASASTEKAQLEKKKKLNKAQKQKLDELQKDLETMNLKKQLLETQVR